MTDKPKSFGRKSIQTSLKPRDLMEERRLVDIWTAKIITLFPGAFPGVLGESLTGRALKDRLWQLETIDLRLFGIGKHRNVDDTPAGGGAGMVLRADVVGPAIDEAMSGAKGNWPLYICRPAVSPSTKKWPAHGASATASPCSAAALRASMNGCWNTTTCKKSRWGTLS